jgi:hypothetical protein
MHDDLDKKFNDATPNMKSGSTEWWAVRFK